MMTTVQHRRLHFLGQGGKLFSVYLINMILTVVTLGLYYPWAKVAIMKYMYEETEFEGSRFTFHGTGKEIFMGFIKAVLIFGALYSAMFLLVLTKEPALIIMGVVVFALMMLVMIPFSIHGSVKYRMSRTSWRGIHFGYRGDRNELMKKFIVNGLITLFTLGFYGPWMAIKIRKYIMDNIRFGNVEFRYEAHGSDYFVLHLKGYFLTYITLGVYSFWYAKNLFNFWVNNTYLLQNGRQAKLRSTATGGAYFELIVPNILLILLTFGLGTPWAMVRTMNFVLDNVVIEGELDTDNILQTEKSYKDATGTEVADMLDLDLV